MQADTPLQSPRVPRCPQADSSLSNRKQIALLMGLQQPLDLDDPIDMETYEKIDEQIEALRLKQAKR